jgi:diguanylate cyclase (GGDEF)-like protein
MDVLSPAVRTKAGPNRCTASPDEELARLRAQVAWLQAERAALWWAASHDELTGLANRRLFCTLAPPLLHNGGPGVVIVVDLNGFKPINDTLGHDVGDAVLQVVAQRLTSCIGHDVVARLGGDEFTCVLTRPPPIAPGEPSAHWWRPAVAALAATIAEPMPVAGHLLHVTASIGVALARDDVLIAELLRRADLAMYHAKANGDCYAVWGTYTGRAPVRPPAPRIAEVTLSRNVRRPSAPTCDPRQRDPVEVAPAGTYRRNDPVWVYREGAWRPGVVESASHRAVMATYRHTESTGTVVDTMTAEYVLVRHAADTQLDRQARGGQEREQPDLPHLADQTPLAS